MKYYKVTNLINKEFFILEEDDEVLFRWDSKEGWFSIYAYHLEYYTRTSRIYRVEQLSKREAKNLIMMEELTR